MVPPSKDRMFVRPSLDGHRMMRQTGGVVSVRPMNGGDWRPVATKANSNLVPATSADGKWVVYVSDDALGKPTLFRVPVLGGTRERLAELKEGLVPSVVTFSPDNKQVLVEVNSDPLTSLWVLENYVQSTK